MREEITKIKCPLCSSSQVKKHGVKRKKLQSIQRYCCNDCHKTFTLDPNKNKVYPMSIVLKSVSLYNTGYTQQQIKKLTNPNPSQKTISNWLNEFKGICTFSKLRNQAIKLYKPSEIIHQQTLNHLQPYTFKYHKAKLYLLFHSIKYNNQFHNISHFYEPLKAYLEKIATDKFPHHIFTYNKDNSATEIDQNNTKNRVFNQCDFSVPLNPTQLPCPLAGKRSEKSAPKADFLDFSSYGC